MSKVAVSRYLDEICAGGPEVVAKIESLLENFQTTPVGNGFIDIITPTDNIDSFIGSMTDLGIAINLVTLWCNCTPDNEVQYGCPHGYGGPRYESCYYSEMCEHDPFDAAESVPELITDDAAPTDLINKYNTAIREYVETGIKARPEYSPCLVPGFSLVVPKEWKRRSYQMPNTAG